MTDLVYLQCLKTGGKLRVRITSSGYKNEANCQFPRNIRVQGRKYSVKPTDIKLIQRGGSYFYSVKATNVKIYESGVVLPDQTIKNMITKVYNTEDTESDCVICMCESKDSVFNPCGHFVCCGECASKVDKCPMCRISVLSIIDYDELK
jgi:hypothetical protein